MNNSQKNAIKLIAIAIEKHQKELILFLKQQGVLVSDNASKDELQTIIVAAISSSETFRKQFAEWAIKKIPKFSNFTNEISSSGIGYNVGSSNATAFGQSGNGLNASLGMSTTQTSEPTKEPTKGGFFAGVTLNSLLDNITSLANNYASIAESKATTAISQSVSQERDNIATEPNSTSSSKTTIVVSVVAVLLLAGTAFYFYKKSKK